MREAREILSGRGRGTPSTYLGPASAPRRQQTRASLVPCAGRFLLAAGPRLREVWWVPRRDLFDAPPPSALAACVPRVLEVVEGIPRGRVMSYGDVGARLGVGPRLVARVMATQGDEVAWWRVLRSDGTCAPHLAARQLRHLRAEGVVLRARDRVDMKAARVTESS